MAYGLMCKMIAKLPCTVSYVSMVRATALPMLQMTMSMAMATVICTMLALSIDMVMITDMVTAVTTRLYVANARTTRLFLATANSMPWLWLYL